MREFKRFQNLIVIIDGQIFFNLSVSYKAQKVLFSKVFSIVVEQLRRKVDGWIGSPDHHYAMDNLCYKTYFELLYCL